MNFYRIAKIQNIPQAEHYILRNDRVELTVFLHQIRWYGRPLDVYEARIGDLLRVIPLGLRPHQGEGTGMFANGHLEEQYLVTRANPVCVESPQWQRLGF